MGFRMLSSIEHLSILRNMRTEESRQSWNISLFKLFYKRLWAQNSAANNIAVTNIVVVFVALLLMLVVSQCFFVGFRLLFRLFSMPWSLFVDAVCCGYWLSILFIPFMLAMSALLPGLMLLTVADVAVSCCHHC